MYAFGPIPSRRLGRSLGINHIPSKACTYSCTYCQVGRTTDLLIERRAFHPPREVIADVVQRVDRLQARGEAIDWLSFVPDGEPTLDANLGVLIEGLRPLGIPIAVITNATLLWQPDVRADLRRADWVCAKIDAVDEAAWNRVDRPHPALELEQVLGGMSTFAREYDGELTTDTMLVAGVNDGVAHVRGVAAFVASLRPRRAFLSVPTRPPAESVVRAPEPDVLQRARDAMAELVPVVTCLWDEVDGRFASTGDAVGDLLRTTAVHPVQLDAALELLARGGAGADTLDALLADGRLIMLQHGGRSFVGRRDP